MQKTTATLCVAVAILSGCGTRATISQAEREVSATITHPLSRKDAYDRVEVSLVSIFNSPRDVTQVKQPENGRIVIKALTAAIVLQRDPLRIAPDVTMTLPFTMDVQSGDQTTKIRYEITGPGEPDYHAQRNGWSPGYPNDMRPVLLQFHASIDRLARDLGGTVADRSPMLGTPPEPAAGTSPKGAGKGR